LHDLAPLRTRQHARRGKLSLYGVNVHSRADGPQEAGLRSAGMGTLSLWIQFGARVARACVRSGCTCLALLTTRESKSGGRAECGTLRTAARQAWAGSQPARPPIA
jgi:hypothetical protein